MSEVVFLGDSITAGFTQLSRFDNVTNMGIGGDKTIEIIGRLNSVTIKKPSKIFLMVGINDFTTNKGKWGDHLKIPFEQSYQLLLDVLKGSVPNTKIITQAILPLNVSSIALEEEIDAFNKEITKWNETIKVVSEKLKIEFIDFTNKFKDEKGRLKLEYTIDGTHLSELGYEVFYESVKPLI